MGSKYTECQKNATERYMQDKHTIRVVVQKEKSDEYKKVAESKSMSLNKFIIDCIENNIQ